MGLQTAGVTTTPWSADYNIHPIFDEFFKALEPKFREMTRRPRHSSDPRFPWLPATGYADGMEFKDNWHFVNSEENRVRLASYWTAETLFALDCAWNVDRVEFELDRLPEESFTGVLQGDHLAGDQAGVWGVKKAHHTPWGGFHG